MLIPEMLLLVAVNDKGHVSPWSGGIRPAGAVKVIDQ
jgi:hypothetical protein